MSALLVGWAGRSLLKLVRPPGRGKYFCFRNRLFHHTFIRVTSISGNCCSPLIYREIIMKLLAEPQMRALTWESTWVGKGLGGVQVTTQSNLIGILSGWTLKNKRKSAAQLLRLSVMFPWQNTLSSSVSKSVYAWNLGCCTTFQRLTRKWLVIESWTGSGGGGALLPQSLLFCLRVSSSGYIVNHIIGPMTWLCSLYHRPIAV